MTYLDSLFGLSGKIAFISGGGGGIGAMMTEGLAHAGARVIIASRKLDQCQATADAINAQSPLGSVEAFAADFSTREGVEAAAAHIGSITDQLHILINNAGRSWGAPYGEFPHDAWDKVMSINVAGMFHLTQALTGLLSQSAVKGDPARIINIGSVMGNQPVAEGAYSYSVSKAGVHHLTRILAREIGAQNITVNALAPGPFESKMTKAWTGTDEGRERIAEKNMFGRIGTPDDIAGCAVFLCSRAGAYTSGSIIPVDGGLNVSVGNILFD